MNIVYIKPEDQEGVMESFWSMLIECEQKADVNNDPVLKHFVNEWYNQYNRVMGTNFSPVWID